MKNISRTILRISTSFAVALLALLTVVTPTLAAQGMKAAGQGAKDQNWQKPPAQKPAPPQLLAEAKMSDGIKMKARAGKQEMVDVIVQYDSPPGYFSITSPGNSPKVITVGSIADKGTGTSMAAAMVSGSALLMLSDDPTLKPTDVKARLMRSARKIAGDPTTVGAGALYIEAALSPQMNRSEEGPVNLVGNTSLTWGGDEWDAGFMWSDSVENDDPLFDIEGNSVVLDDDQ